MGEAKGRKRAGTYPQGGPVESFRVPNGKVGITIDVGDEPPSTIMLDTDKLVLLLDAPVQTPDFYKLAPNISHGFAKAKREGNQQQMEALGLAIMRSAFEHPKFGKHTRSSVSSELRKTGKAHITWRSHSGLAIAVASQFVPLDRPLDRAKEAAPPGAFAIVAINDEPNRH